MMSRILIVLLSLGVLVSPALAQQKNNAVTSIPKVLVRSPNPAKLAEFYKALGFSETARNQNSVNFYLEGDVGAFEVL